MRQPTIRQIKAFQYVNQGMSKRAALKAAGYSTHTAAQGIRVMQTKSMKSLTESLKDELESRGLTIPYLADKFMEWLEAKQKDDEPNYDVQIKGYDRLKDIWGIEDNQPRLKRKLTIEDFVFGNKDSGEEDKSIDESVPLSGFDTDEEINTDLKELPLIEKPSVEQKPEPVLEPGYDKTWKEFVNWSKFNSWKMFDYKKPDLLEDIKKLEDYEKSAPQPIDSEFIQVKNILIQEKIARGL